MSGVRIVLILTENWTMRPTPDVADLVQFAVEAERAGEPAGLRAARQPGPGYPVAEPARPAQRDRRCHHPRPAGRQRADQPAVSWHRDEYAALGVPFAGRGAITICVKPSQFLDSTAGIGAFGRRLAEKAAA